MTQVIDQEIDPALKAVQRHIHEALAPRPRAIHIALLLGSITCGLLLLSLWLTEPSPLPFLTQVGFGLLTLLCFAWSGYAAFVLRTRRPLFGAERVIATRIGLAASLAWLAMTIVIAASRPSWAWGLSAVASSATIGALAVVLWRRTELEVRRLRELAHQLEARVNP